MVFTKDMKHLDVLGSMCEKNDLKVVWKRPVPIDTDALGEQALDSLPFMTQVFVKANSLISTKRFDALLYLSRKETEHALIEDEDFYIPSMSARVISYKGLVMPTTIKQFYVDLQDEDFEISFSAFSAEFFNSSTSTLSIISSIFFNYSI